MSISAFIKSMMNIMRDDAGIDGSVQTLSQIVWMLFLRIYDQKEEDWELFEDNYKSPLPEECRWRKWVRGESQNSQLTGEELLKFVNDTLFPAIKGLEIIDTTPRRVSILKDMFMESNNYMKDGVCLRKAVNLIDGIEFDNYEESHAFNDIYEGLLKELQAAGKQGEYYTPRALTSWITDRVAPKMGEKVADFASGTGGFAVSALEYIRAHIKMKRAEDEDIIQENIMCVEKKQLPYMLCTTNLLLHGIADPKVTHGNSLERNVREYREDEKVDVVLMNPPYGGHEQSTILNNFPADLRNSETADLFMIEILYRLKKNGRVGIILPDGFMFGTDNSKVAIKKKLMSECNLHTVIRMCGSVFAPYTSISTNLLFFDKTGPTKETWFYRFDLPEGYKAFSKTRPLTLEHMQVITDWWDNRVEVKDEKEDESMTETWKAKKYSIEEIIERGYNIDLCGFPTNKEIILSPEETMERYVSQKEELEHQLSKATLCMKAYLNGDETVELVNIKTISDKISALDQSFPDDMKKSLLQAALWGKLTEQLPTDSSVDELLAKIITEKEHLIKVKNMKKEKQLAPIAADEIPFDIPESWRWVRLGDVVKVNPRNDVDGNLDVSFIPMTLLEDGYRSKFTYEVRKWKDVKKGFTHFQENDVVFAKIVPCFQNLKSAVMTGLENEFGAGTTELHVLRSYGNNICLKYLLWFVKNPMFIADGETTMTGTAGQQRVSTDFVKNYLLPLPPLEEQYRIVEKLDKLLPCCEGLVE